MKTIRCPSTRTTIDFLRTFFTDRVGSEDFLPYDNVELQAACGGDPQRTAETGGRYHIVKSARDTLKEDPDLIFIDVLDGIGLYRVRNENIAAVVRRTRLRRVTELMRRGRTEMQCVDVGRLTTEQLATWNSTVFHLAAIQAASSPEAIKRIEDAVAGIDPLNTARKALETLRRLTT